MSKIVFIAGSPSAPSRSTAILRFAAVLCAESSLETELIELRDLPPDGLLFGAESPAMTQARASVVEADAIVAATPVYKAAYSGLLKTFLDYFPEGSLRGKAAYPIATGGSNAHLLAVDYALKPVLSVLGASRILEGLYVPNEAATVAEDGSIVLREEYDARLRAGIADLIASVRVPSRR